MTDAKSNEKKKKDKSMKHAPFWRSARILWRYKRLMGWALAGLLANAVTWGAGMGMMLPTFHLLIEKQQTLADLVDDYLGGTAMADWVKQFIPDDQFYAFVLVVCVMAVNAFVSAAGAYVHQYLTVTIAFRATMLWRVRMFRRLLHAPIELARNSGDEMTRIVVDSRLLASGYLAIMSKAGGEVARGIAVLIVAILLSWKLTTIAIVMMLFGVLILGRFGRIIRRATRGMLREFGNLGSTINESMAGLRVVKVHNAEGQVRRRFNVINKAIYTEEIRARHVRAFSSPLMRLLGGLATAAIATVAAWLILRRGIPPAEFLTVMGLLAMASTSIKPLTRLHIELHEASAAAERVFEICDLPVEPGYDKSDHYRPPLARHQKNIVFENITFVYPNQERAALDNVSLTVEHGQAVAIVGGNGSGKTTLLSMLPRLINPTSGRVLIDGVDIAEVRLRSVRRQLGVVTQNSVLFEGTIADNIAFGRRYVARDQIIAAAKAAHAEDFIETTTDGYDTKLGEGGTGLSGGQRQRLCIARALLRDPAIMIMDEATSQIDADSESSINEAVRELRQNRTTLVIAHRLSTVVDADMIVVMDDGHIVDQGKHEELLQRCEVYQTLTQTQLQPSADDAA